MNVELLLKVKAAILAEPDKFDMMDWQTHHDCGTACCIGGWANVLHQGKKDPQELTMFQAVGGTHETLGLSQEESDRLCYTVDWPSQFKEVYDIADNAKDRGGAAAIAADRIDHFIATEGRE